MFMFCDGNNNWNLSHAESGLKLAGGRSKTACMESLKKHINRYGKEKVFHKIEEEMRLVTSCIGANPRYKTAYKRVE